jgi:hypothetical protein
MYQLIIYISTALRYLINISEAVGSAKSINVQQYAYY